MLRPRGWADLFWANDCIFITTSHQYMIYYDIYFAPITEWTEPAESPTKTHRVWLRLTRWEPQSKGPVSAEVFGAFWSFSVPKVLPFLKGVALERLKCPEEVGGTWPRKLQVAACCYLWTFFFHLPCPIFSTTVQQVRQTIVAWDLLSIYIFALATMTKMLDALQTFKVKLNEDPIESM